MSIVVVIYKARSHSINCINQKVAECIEVSGKCKNNKRDFAAKTRNNNRKGSCRFEVVEVLPQRKGIDEISLRK